MTTDYQVGEALADALGAVRELVQRWVIESNWRSGGVRATYKRCADELHALLADAAALRSAQVPEVNPLREYAKRNLRKLIELGSTDKALMNEAVAFARTFTKGRKIFYEHKWRLHKHIVEIIDKEDPAFIEPLNLMIFE